MSAELAANATKQMSLFPIYISSGKTIEEHKAYLEALQFNIKDPLLYGCITYGDGLADKSLQGFPHHKGLATALLTFFTRRALDLYRYPFYEDRLLTADGPIARDSQRDVLGSILSGLDDERIKRICGELRQIYEHTQHHLKRLGLSTVTLSRCIDDIGPVYRGGPKYAQLACSLKRAAEITGTAVVQLEMDTLNSYGETSRYGRCPVVIWREVPVADVLYCSNLIATRDSSRAPAVESGEWVVINRALDGVVSIPTANIQIISSDYKPTFTFSEAHAPSYLRNYQPMVFRPAVNCRFDNAPSYAGKVIQRTFARRIKDAIYAFKHGWLED